MNGQFLIQPALSLFAAMILVPAMGAIARKTGAMSHIDARRRRARPIPLLGGVAIYLSSCAALIWQQNTTLALLLASAAPVICTGTLDDYRELSARPKLFAQLLSATFWVVMQPVGGLILEQVGVPHGASQALTVVWIVGITNSLNLIDGMDGLAGGVGFIVLLMLGILGGETLRGEAATAVSSALLGFLFFNLPPARIYLGDSGSGFVGFTLAALASTLTIPPETGIAGIFAPLLLLAFPEVDTLLAIARRLKNGRPIFRGDHSHLHHKLQKIGFKVRHALIIIYMTVGYSSLGVFTMWRLPANHAALVLAITILGLVGALAFIFLWDHILGERISLHTHTVITECLNLQNERTGVGKPYPGLALNLAHCYKEFQHATPDHTEAFAHEFAQMIKKFFPEGLFKTAEKSSVVVFFEDPSAVAQKRLDAFRNAFKTLMRSYNILGSEDDDLEGTILYLPGQRTSKFVDRSDAHRKRAA